ncbi:hypothetical protein [Microbacterium oxydans]|uniref:hypothetical protein n=1 Tax=Microbacterium oxydans TaxID=82380 RepID=UPI001E41F7EE|nr:hypothetical protein [Microbacterium oxydans]
MPGAVPLEASSATVPVYRFWSPTFQGHFYTADAVERDKIIAQWGRDWTYEGQRYSAHSTQVAGSVPLYRFWSDRYKGHFFTAEEGEKNLVIEKWSDTWSFEGVAYYVFPPNSSIPDTSPVFRFWGAGVSHHFYTASNAERDNVISRWPNTWSYESERFRVPSDGMVSDPVPPRPSDVDCSDFATWADAQSYFGKYYAYYGDIARLDADGDLIACEGLPGAP